MQPAPPPAGRGQLVQVLRRLLRPLVGKEPSFYRVVAACFLIASTLWMLRALSKSYVAPLNYPISWRYNTARYHPARPLPLTVPVEVRGNGWRLLSRALGMHLPPADVRLRLPGTPPLRSLLRPPLRRALGTVLLVSLPADSATYYLVPGGDSLKGSKNLE
ncbi:hypothetical protein [Hymenobacter psoromatis]|uniref:hypothetical protein n=1 Tax=Hymenobacter psoromatis TaxID=1484116 RepID=UPI001CBDB554|nr:hypothetical protein [Hymenobacter psoromatis]